LRKHMMKANVSEGDVAVLVAGGHLPQEASRDPGAIKGAVEGLMADVAFELEAERSTRSLRGKRVTTRPDPVTRDERGGPPGK
jgi:hypothetical protein